MENGNVKSYKFYCETDISDKMMKLIVPNEKELFAVKTIRDFALFTNKRIIICDKQGVTGKKTEYYVIPYKSIVTYSVETTGVIDIDGEINLVLSGRIPVKLEFVAGASKKGILMQVYKTIAEYVSE